MIQINRLLEFLAECKSEIVDATKSDKEGNPLKLFNYVTMVVDDSELSQVLKEREELENTFLIAIVPEFNMRGESDNSEWQNIAAFFVLDKTDYSEHDRDSFINVFAQTQFKANAFIDKLLEDKSNSSGLFCNFLAKLDENSITVRPVWKKNDCNGWIIELNFNSPL